MKTNLTRLLIERKAGNIKSLAVLLDPDKVGFESLPYFIEKVVSAGVDFIFVGGSLITNYRLDRLISTIKQHCAIPVVLFPGSNVHIEPAADAILLLSLISGRNPELLIGQHVTAAPLLKRSKLEIIPTGYILVESGRPTTVSYISNTLPVPSDKPEIASCTAMAGEMLGLKTIFLDAGSGALFPVPSPMIRAVASSVEVPLIVGGGIDSVEKATEAFGAGADVIVVGNAIERDPKFLESLALVEKADRVWN